MVKFAIAFILLTVPALAQTIEVPIEVTEPSPWLQLWAEIQPAVMTIVTALIGVVATWLGYYAKQFLGEKAALAAQQIFQEGAMNAAGFALNKLGSRAITEEIKHNDPAIREAIGYLKEAVPDTIRDLKIPNEVLADKILANLGKLTAPSITATSSDSITINGGKK